MFYSISKFIWVILQPVNLLLLFLFVFLLLSSTGYKQIGRIGIWGTLISFLFLAFTPIGPKLLNGLESSAPLSEIPRHVDGIIVLGGGVDWFASDGRTRIQLSGGSERVISGIELALRYPNSVLIYSGHVGYGKSQRYTENGYSNLTDLIVALGVERERIIIDRESRNTADHAPVLMRSIKPKSDENWILVTSAFHMSRAVEVFKNSNWDVIPYAVDYRTSKYNSEYPYFYDTLSYLDACNLWFKEMIGRYVYRVTGKS